ncbi:uncharacterized protein AB675_8984 [Cyphellophora attinorum]|uniref:Uncharacterized protein n=1 Tax=Cyphellophora attinorum TaxID=1664694 RepID=A0A0N1NXG4_9EURO|nr:uncharacterized protein AB675_8984 [Phialophora attinorum]KPI34312.1 hypothetical protein AB675_8984 [Phialophora attinorum]
MPWSSADAVLDPALKGLSAGCPPAPGIVELADDCAVAIRCLTLSAAECVLSIQRYIPDCLLSEDNNPAAPELLHVFLKSAGLKGALTWGFDPYTFAGPMTVYAIGANNFALTCDGTLLADRIRREIDAAGSLVDSDDATTENRSRSRDQLTDLLALNGMCGLPVPVRYEMLHACVRHDLGSCLSLLLQKHVFGVPGKTKDRTPGASVTKEELQTLCGRAAGHRNGQLYTDLDAAVGAIRRLEEKARARGYPHWQDFAYAVRNGYARYKCYIDDHVEDCDGFRCMEISSDDERDSSEADNDGLDGSGLDDSDSDNGDVGSSGAHESDADEI